MRCPLALSLAAAFALTLASTARAQEIGRNAVMSPAALGPPPTGMDFLGAGIAFSTIGALSLVAAPLCNTNIVEAAHQSSCFEATFLVGVPATAVGIPFIVAGALQHAKYKLWLREHPLFLALRAAPLPHGGGVVGYGLTF